MPLKQNKLNTIKEYKQITVEGKLPVALDNLDKAKYLLHEAKTHKNIKLLVVPTIYTVEAKESLKIAKKALNDAIKAKQAEAKSIDLAIKELETEVKDTALAIVEITKTPAKDRSGNYKTDENGEVVYNETHNLNKDMFAFTPASVKHEVDRDALLATVLEDKENPIYKGLLKEEVTHYLDNGVLNDLVLAGKIKLPMKEIKADAKISIKGANILKSTNELLEGK